MKGHVPVFINSFSSAFIFLITFWFFCLFMLQIVLPVLYYIPGDQNHHSYENSLDALLMMKNDAKLLIMSSVFT